MGTPPQAVVKAAQQCLPSCSSLVPLPQHRRTTSSLAAEHPGALLLPQQTSPGPSGSSPLDLPSRRTVMLRERLCWLETRLILNKDNNDSGDQAALCVKSAGKDTFELLTGE